MNKNQKKTRWGAVVLGIAMMLGMIFFAPATKVDSLALVQAKVIPESAKIRAKADTNSDQLGSAEQGKNLDVISQTKGTDGKVWYKVYIDGQTTGYIRGDLVTANGTIPEESAAQETKPEQPQGNQTTTTTATSGNKVTVGSNNTQSSSTTETTQPAAEAGSTAANVSVSESKVITAKVNSSSVRVRKGPGTNYDVSGNAPGNTEVSVSGEATDAEGKVWYQVSFNLNNATVNGFIRNDFLEILETLPENAEAEPVEEEVPAEEAAPEDELVTLENEDYFLKYMQNGEGQMDWFLFDNIKGTSQSLTALLQAAETNAEVDQADADMLSKLKLIVIVMAVVIFLLFIIMTVLLFKLRDASYEEEDDEEDEEEEEEPVVERRGFRNRRPVVEEEDQEDQEEEEEEPASPKRGLFGRKKAVEEEEEVEVTVKASKKSTPVVEEEEATENTGSIDFMDVVDDDMVFDFIDNYKK